MRAELAARERLLLAIGLIACLCALSLAAWNPPAALTGWLAAAAAFAGIPAGALCLQSMMTLIPGAWGKEMRLACEAGGLLTLPALAAFLPVLAGLTTLYPPQAGGSTFQQHWLAPAGLSLRILLWFGLLAAGEFVLRHRRYRVPVSVMLLFIFALLGSFVAIDWLMALDRSFSSSSFGVMILIFWVEMAFAALLLLRLPLGRPPRRIGVLGALLLTMSLLWAYIQFLGFFINWSPGLPEGAAWYGARSGGGWSLVIALFGLLGGMPLLMLILPRFRRSRRWLMGSSGAILAGKLIEFGWLALPGRGGVGIAAFLLAAVGLGLLAMALLPLALRRRVIARQPGTPT